MKKINQIKTIFNAHIYRFGSRTILVARTILELPGLTGGEQQQQQKNGERRSQKKVVNAVSHVEQTHNNYYTRLSEQHMKGDKTIVNFFCICHA